MECFREGIADGVCRLCGFEPSLPNLPLSIRFDEQSPTNNLHPGNLLGSSLDYNAVGFTNRGDFVKRWIEEAMEDRMTMRVKSLVQDELKRVYPEEAITDYAGRLVVKEVAEFRASFPMLARSKKVQVQLASNVMRRLEMLYPRLRLARQGVGHLDI